MAAEILFGALKSYIDPFFASAGWYIDASGYIMNQDAKEPLRVINTKYNGEPDKSPYIALVVPNSDEHYTQLKEIEGTEIFNPFVSIKHMCIVAIMFKNSLLAYHLSNKALNSGMDESKLKDLIQFYNATEADGRVRVGFCNTEDPENPVDVYTYIDDDIIKATWGLCVVAYNATNRKHPAIFDNIDKSWKKVLREMDEWDRLRKHIFSDVKEENLSVSSIDHMDLSDSSSIDRGEQYQQIKCRPFDYVDDSKIDEFLTTMFNPDELETYIPDEEEIVEDEEEPDPASIAETISDSELAIGSAVEESLDFSGEVGDDSEDVYAESDEENDEETEDSEKEEADCEYSEESQSTDHAVTAKSEGPSITLNRNVMMQNGFGSMYGMPMPSPMSVGYPQFGMGMGMNPFFSQQNMGMMGNQQNGDIRTMDLTGGENTDPFAAYR